MAKTLFDFDDYRAYLKFALPVSGPLRGSRSKLAESLGCQSAFVSLVLGGNTHFSLEHSAKISRFLKLDEDEQDFFLLLVHLARAGSKDLEDYYKKRIEAIRRRRREIKERVVTTQSLSESDQLTYYSSWHFTAVHMCLMVPHLQERRSISTALQLPTDTVSSVLNFLTRTGLAEQRGDKFVCGPIRIHLPDSSPLVSKHHTNWRMRAVQSLDNRSHTDLHYSSVMTLSEVATERIRDLLLQTIQDSEPIIKDAKNEIVCALSLDLFQIAGKP